MSTSEWKPTVADVANVIKSRTRDNNGNEVGTFTTDTRPTFDQVTALLEDGTNDVAAIVGEVVPEVLWADARRVAAISTAMLVEVSYYSDQVAGGSSPYTALERMFNDKSKRLSVSIQNARAGGSTGADPLKPAGGFPMTGDPFIIGRATQW